jgi:hypothetical protein
MEPDIDSFLLLYARFDYSQRAEAIRRLNEYIEGGQAVRDRIVKESERRNSVKKMDVGPTSVASCVCCGR